MYVNSNVTNIVNIVLGHITWTVLTRRKTQTNSNNRYTYLKKSFLQYSFPSREKHLSVSVTLQSVHCTQRTCHAWSSTLSKNLSSIGLSQPAQVCISDFSSPTASLELLSNTFC